MMRRIVWIGGAVVLAAAVLGLSLWVGSPGMEPLPGADEADTSESARGSGETNAPDDPDIPEIVPYNPDQRADPDRIGQAAPGTGDGGRYVFQDDDRTTFLTYRRFDARPLGVIDIVEPTADIVFSPSRVVSIRADEATIVAPENQLRSGAFRGNVVVTLHQADTDQTVDPRAEDHVQLRVFLEEANFDIELGSLESTGDIRLVGQRVTFEGAGLSMTYNDLKGRIDRLEVYRGKELRFKPDGPTTADNDRATPQASNMPESGPAKDATASNDTEAGPEFEAEPDPFYRARFEDDVKLRNLDETLRMDGDFLDLTFALGESRLGDEARGNAQHSAEPDEPAPTPDSLSAGSESPGKDAHGPTMSDTQANQEPEPGPDDIIITWTGRLLIVPEESPPADLKLGGPDAVLMRLSGQPVSIVTPDDQTVVAAEVDYLTSTGRLRAAAGPESAMVIHDPAVGTLRGMELSVDQQRGSGFVVGPGQLEATDDTDAPLTVAWDDRLDLRFYQRDTDGDPTEQMVDLDRLAGIRSAEFRGNVAAYEERFDIAADQLAIHLDPPVHNDADPTLDRIDASGDVRLNATDDDGSPWHIASQELTVGLETDERGEAYPTRITAREDVATTLPPMPGEGDEFAFNGLDLTAGMLDVTLEPRESPPPALEAEDRGEDENTPAPTDTQENQGSDSLPEREKEQESELLANNLAVKRFVAEEDVRVTLHDTGVELFAERMNSRGADRLEMFGSDADPAQIQRGGDRLAGNQIVISRDGQTVDVPGPGMLDARLTARDELDSDQADLMTVTWTDAMRYDHPAGRTTFAGGVNVATTSPDGLDRTRLTSDDLELTLAEAGDDTEAPHVNAGPSTDQPDPDSSTDDPFFGDRTIDTVTATGDARFVAERDTLSEREDPFDETEPQYRSLEARLTLMGPTIAFNRADEKVTVPDAGAMIVQNYTPDDMPASEASPQEATKSGIVPGTTTRVDFTGRGETLFTWTESLTLDAAGNDMLMLGNVRMIHRPPSESGSEPPRVVQLDADRLLANLADTGGLDALLAGAQPQPEIETIEADGSVSVLYESKLISADEMDYVEAERTIRFTAGEGRLVRVRDGNEPRAGLEAAAISWNLDTDKLTISEVEGGALPVSRE